MKRTTVKLPDDLDLQLRHEAERRHMTVSALTREAIEAYLRPESLPGGQRRALFSAGAGDSSQSCISERIEEILREELGR